MAELRITVHFRDTVGGDERNRLLRELGEALAGGSAAGGETRPAGGETGAGGESDGPQRVRAMPEPDEQGELHPMFLLRVDDAAMVNAVMRSLGGWAMQHPTVPLVLKATGRGGRVAFELKRFSTVAFAHASARLADAIGGSPAGEQA